MLFIGSVVGLALGVTSAAFRVGDEQLSAALEAAASQVIIPATADSTALASTPSEKWLHSATVSKVLST